MNYEGYRTFDVEQDGGVLTVTIDFPPVNLQGQEMLADSEQKIARPRQIYLGEDKRDYVPIAERG